MLCASFKSCSTFLKLLIASTIGVKFDSSLLPDDNGVIALVAENIHNLLSTTVTAIAQNPDAVITVNGIEYNDIAVFDVELNTDITFDIVVETGASSATYRLTIISVFADRTALREQINLATNIPQGNYRDVTWVAFQIALAKAKEVAANTDATQEEIDDALIALNAAFKNLKMKCGCCDEHDHDDNFIDRLACFFCRLIHFLKALFNFISFFERL